MCLCDLTVIYCVVLYGFGVMCVFSCWCVFLSVFVCLIVAYGVMLHGFLSVFCMCGRLYVFCFNVFVCCVCASPCDAVCFFVCVGVCLFMR